MLDDYGIELAISKRLKPLRNEFEKHGIPIAFLPNEATNYKDDRCGAIRIVIPAQKGRVPSSLVLPQYPGIERENYTLAITQDVDAEVFIRLNLPTRYQSNQALSFVARKIVATLIGFIPMPFESMKMPLYFKSYELLQPNNDRWLANIVMGFMGQIKAIPEEFETIVQRVELFGTDDINFLKKNILLYSQDLKNN